jgi:hypothetical protein
MGHQSTTPLHTTASKARNTAVIAFEGLGYPADLMWGLAEAIEDGGNQGGVVTFHTERGIQGFMMLWASACNIKSDGVVSGNDSPPFPSGTCPAMAAANHLAANSWAVADAELSGHRALGQSSKVWAYANAQYVVIVGLPKSLPR